MGIAVIYNEARNGDKNFENKPNKSLLILPGKSNLMQMRWKILVPKIEKMYAFSLFLNQLDLYAVSISAPILTVTKPCL